MPHMKILSCTEEDLKVGTEAVKHWFRGLLVLEGVG